MKASPSNRAEIASPQRRAAFTLIELLTVISIIAILAGLLVGLAPAAGVKMREARVRAELNQLLVAIDEYKSKYGFYPPDGLYTQGPLKGQANPALSPLYYELTGMQVIKPTQSDGYFQSLDSEITLRSAEIQLVFGRDGIANSSPERRRVLTQSFKPKQHEGLFPTTVAGKPDIDLLVVPVPWPRTQPPVITEFGGTTQGLNPWRYVSSNPTNNPTTFDLWAEFFSGVEDVRNSSGQVTGKRPKKVIIGNWKQ
jgi:prepilin-type N-terminal cleavage/methylation domain-containing protein